MTTNHYDVPVLIAGGGPVGMSLALDLNHMGTTCLVAEQDPGTAVVLLAKAGTVNERTMEYCRRWGLVDEIASVFPPDLARDTVYCTALDGHVLGRSVIPSADQRGTPMVGPEMLRRCGQHLFDPILANAAIASEHATVRYNLRFESFTQDADGVTSLLTDVTTGEQVTVRSQYLVGCDGAGSTVRKTLGVEFELIAQMDFSLSAMIKFDDAELYKYIPECERMMFIGSEGTWANMTAIDGHGLWRFTVVGNEEALDPATFDINPIVRRALGNTGIQYEVLRLVPWRRAQMLATSYAQGRVLLAGDTVHTTSPTGGHGVNTGIGDATDASWMVSALVAGWGGPGLIDAYTAERRPVGWRNFGNSTQNYKVWVGAGMTNVLAEGPKGDAARKNIGNMLTVGLHQEWFSQGIGMGYRYEGSPIVVPDGTPEPADEPSNYQPTARPGHRAPHAWLADGRSMLDLFGKGFVLLNFGAAAADVAALTAAAAATGVPLTVEAIDQPEIAGQYGRLLVLVRPDGQVAWRADSAPADAQQLFDVVRGAAA
ncbi:MAG: FAD-dependent monooxygenase [Actinomycetota bacterium]|nr:FAD-dependent monooxygenase [Actinomycetota bacterium]